MVRVLPGGKLAFMVSLLLALARTIRARAGAPLVRDQDEVALTFSVLRKCTVNQGHLYASSRILHLRAAKSDEAEAAAGGTR